MDDTNFDPKAKITDDDDDAEIEDADADIDLSDPEVVLRSKKGAHHDHDDVGEDGDESLETLLDEELLADDEKYDDEDPL